MLQASGETSLRQGDRHCKVQEGDMSLLDEEEPFTLSGSTSSQIVFVRMPRAVVASRHPGLVQQTAVAIDRQQPGSRLVHGNLMNIIAALPNLTERQRGVALEGFVHLLGVLEPDQQECRSSWRVQAALDFIALNYCDAGLRAEDVAAAQRISRRRLDALMVASTGLSLTALIWKRRLEQAAQDLHDPVRRQWSASKIGYANGFNQPGHFSRAFKERFGSTPLQFRGRALEVPDPK
jgi:AraC-like DNA-binding protein